MSSSGARLARQWGACRRSWFYIRTDYGSRLSWKFTNGVRSGSITRLRHQLELIKCGNPGDSALPRLFGGHTPDLRELNRFGALLSWNYQTHRVEFQLAPVLEILCDSPFLDLVLDDIKI